MFAESQAEIVHDFRRFYGISAEEAGWAYSYGEALILLHSLKNESLSLLGAKLNGFDRPFHPLMQDIANLWELVEGRTRGKKGGKKVEYPRPWKVKTMFEKKHGKVGGEPMKLGRFKRIMKGKRRELSPAEAKNLGK